MGDTILVVEDRELLRKVIGKYLEDSGYSVVVAASGELALRTAAASAEPIGAAIVDLSLPGMEGSTLGSRLREHYPGCHIVFVTGHSAHHPLVRRASSVDNSQVLPKPFPLSALVAALPDLP